MASRGKKANWSGLPSRGRGAVRSTDTKGRNTLPNKSSSKNGPPKQSNRGNTTRPYVSRPSKSKFGEGDTMESAQRMVDMERRNASYLSQTKYCGAPPMSEDLVQVRLVIPGDHLVPKALSDLGVLDNICREHKVWITREAGYETYFDISSFNIKSLHVALDAVNQRIHHMRLSEESLTMQYFVQSPENDEDVAIIFEVDKRPVIEGVGHAIHYPGYALDGLIAQFATALPSAVKTLVAVPGLKMQINFGRLNILTKRKTVGNRLLLEEFESALDSYSSRGRGANIETEFTNIQVADKFLSSILHDDEFVQANKTDMTMHHHVQFDIDKQTVFADLREEEGVAKATTSSIYVGIEGHPPLNWVISAPEMSADWSFRVNSRPHFDRSGQLSDATAKFVESFVFKIGRNTHTMEANTSSLPVKAKRHFRLPKWQMFTRLDLAQVTSNLQVKSCARLRYLETPYEIEIFITQHWDKLLASAQPDRLSWSVSVYGIHWEEALGELSSSRPSSGFEEGLLRRLWPGEGSLEERLEEFFECVLSVQTAISKLQS